MSHMPRDTDRLRTEGVHLAFSIDGDVNRRFRPTNIDIDTLSVEETEFAYLRVDFNFDLGPARSHI